MNEANSPPPISNTDVTSSDNASDTSLSLSDNLPDSFTISVVMESRPSKSDWCDETWNAVGLVPFSESQQGDVKIIEQGDIKQLVYGGLKIRLFLDECESYYHNLMSPEPGCFVVAHEDDEKNDDIPVPFLVTLSFDEAHAYLEGDDTVYSVPIPPELYRWAEAYILENYSAEKRRKRKRKDWRKGE